MALLTLQGKNLCFRLTPKFNELQYNEQKQNYLFSLANFLYSYDSLQIFDNLSMLLFTLFFFGAWETITKEHIPLPF
jgi:hypothetical protein